MMRPLLAVALLASLLSACGSDCGSGHFVNVMHPTTMGDGRVVQIPGQVWRCDQ